MSPFVTLLAHPHLAVHVQSIDTWTSFFFLCVYFWNIFTYRTANRFTSHCKISSTSSLCTLMRRCYSEKQKLETILLHYSQLSGYLFTVFAREESTGTHANLTTDRARMPTNFEKLKSLSLKFASRNIVDIFPWWAGILQKILTNLLYVSFCCTFCVCAFIYFSSFSYDPTFRWSLTSTKKSWNQHLPFLKFGRSSSCWLSKNRSHYCPSDAPSLTATVSQLKNPSNSSLLSFQL